MGKRWQLFSYLILTLSIGFVNTAFAQNEQETRTGCLMKGSKAGTYYLVDEPTGRRVQITGPGLEKLTEVGQSQISATGKLAHVGGKDVYEATEVKQTREICAPIAFNSAILKDEVGKARFGVRTGFSLDPELVIIGGQALLGPVFKELWFRPTAEYSIGEVTKLFNASGEALYFIPSSGVGQKGHVNLYAGGGLGFNLTRKHFNGLPDRPDTESDSDWSTDFGLNLVVGGMKSNGLFAEVRASAWIEPTIRVYLGYSFH